MLTTEFNSEKYSYLLDNVIKCGTNYSILNIRRWILSKNVDDFHQMFQTIYHKILILKTNSHDIDPNDYIRILYHINDVLYYCVIMRPHLPICKMILNNAFESIIGIFGEICEVEMMIHQQDNDSSNSIILHKILLMWEHLELLPDDILQQCKYWKLSLEEWKLLETSQKFIIQKEDINNISKGFQSSISFQLKKPTSNNNISIFDDDLYDDNFEYLNNQILDNEPQNNITEYDNIINSEIQHKKSLDVNIIYHNEKRLTHLPASLMLTFIPIDDTDISKPIEDKIEDIPDFNKIINIRPLDDKLKLFYSTVQKYNNTESDGWCYDNIKHFIDTKQRIISNQRNIYFDKLEQTTVKLNDYLKNRDDYIDKDISQLQFVSSDISLSGSESIGDSSDSDDNEVDGVSDTALFDITSTDKILEKYSQNSPYIRSKKLVPTIPPDNNVYVTEETKINCQNIGHQLLLKMGWDGGSLGKKKDGIVEPIRFYDIRTDSNKFKGVGHNKGESYDPFDEYRKSMSTNYGKR